MSANNKLAARFHPRVFTCDCGSEYTSAIAAMYCCDPAAPGPAAPGPAAPGPADNPRPERYYLSED